MYIQLHPIVHTTNEMILGLVLKIKFLGIINLTKIGTYNKFYYTFYFLFSRFLFLERKPLSQTR